MDMALDCGIDWVALRHREGLAALDRRFLTWLQGRDPAVHERLLAARAEPAGVSRPEESALLMVLGPLLENFLGGLFGVEAELAALAAESAAQQRISTCKRLFVQRQAVKKYPDPSAFDGPALRAALEAQLRAPFSEAAFASAVESWQQAGAAAELDVALRYAAWATLTAAGRAMHAGGTLFAVPARIDSAHLVEAESRPRAGQPMFGLAEERWRTRDGFSLTDQGMRPEQALDQMNYCIWCHPQGKDSCSRGLAQRGGEGLQRSPLGVVLAGCPLEEKISEMHALRAAGSALGAFAAIIVDNPMLAATGHRICNDCMKACIYQKQQPVDIPQAETAILKEVLALPWGFEIYALLTRWNPLNIRRPLPAPDSGKKVLVVGLGPAGFTLAHHLLNDGHWVVAIDGLKIEPLGFDPARPVRDVTTLFEDLDDRVMAGFGGVAEYGITVRWNKNYLKLVRVLLERRRHFAAFGGVRLGGGATLSVADAWAMGFDHVALCLGAGRPTVLDIPNGLARGVREASDFLMALQLTGAAKRASIANLQLRLPVVVVGGGLTAIDTATESLAYYVRQVEKFAARYAVLVAERGTAAVRAVWNEEEAAIADVFLEHARALATERSLAAAEGRPPRLGRLLDSWGGATIAYRRKLVQSPAYTLSHEEIQKAMEEGVRFAEELTPLAVEVDAFGHAEALRCRRTDGSEVVLPARAVLVAAGTHPNTVLAREEGALGAKDPVVLDGRHFQAIDASGAAVTPERGVAKPAEARVLMHRSASGRFVSFFGDLHPSYSGNVVKAMASARQGYRVVSAVLAAVPASAPAGEELIARCRESFSARVVAVERLAPNIVEVVLHAPAAARAFRPGQFFRLQNYERNAHHLEDPVGERTVLAMEGLALTGAWTDPGQGRLGVIVLEMGGSSSLCALLRPGEPVVLMGPTGTPTEIVADSTVALVGGGLGNAVLFSIGAALRRAGTRVLYFAGYKAIRDRYKVEEIEQAADAVVWCCDEAPGFVPRRPQDRAFVGDIVQAMAAYGAGRLGSQAIALHEVEQMLVIGSDGMMRAVGAARHGVLAPYLKPGHRAIGSINAPMQCMMKEVCGQCLQQHVDPETGRRSVVFSCFNQDQQLDRVDFPSLHERLRQNSVHEKLTAQWIARALRRLEAQAQPPAATPAAAGAADQALL
jgi:NADPH-dependent glutamate synthase beta subunit-like oxidoreductase/NAD(P)H-flavin reductase